MAPALPPCRGHAARLIARSVALALGLTVGHASSQPAPRRLSDWLLAQPYTPDSYPLGLSWLVADEVPAQHALRQELLQALAGGRPEMKVNGEAAARLRAWLSLLPVTGRVPVAVADARWLQANPLRDPVLLASHSVMLPRRPTTVTVVKSDGTLCTIRHARGREASAYLSACAGGRSDGADWAWVAQPDGRVARYGIAVWNHEPQDEVAPGAWLWAPPRGSGWSERFSTQLIAFLATQGPAPDVAPQGVNMGEGPSPSIAKAPARPRGKARIRHNTTPGGPATGFGVPPENVTESLANGTASPAIVDASRLPLRTFIAAAPPATVTNARRLDVSASDWGNAGLLQTPTARMRPNGDLSLTYNRTLPYTRQNVFFQPLDWLEIGFRYVDISNRLYDASATISTQSFKDKSFDAKLRLWPESAYMPAVAVGARDLAGTGLFSSEYLVASKRVDNFDFSLGIGWGYLAGQVRDNAAVGTGGLPGIKNYFRGTPRAFGGLQYQTPWDKLSLKLEYDGNNYQNEPLGNTLKRGSPLNAGLVYRAGRNADVTLGVERGNTVMLGVTLHTQLDGMSTPKVSDPPRVAVEASRPKVQTAAAVDWAKVSKDVETQSTWQVASIEHSNGELRLKLDNADAPYWRYRMDRATAVLHAKAPPDIDRFVYTYRQQGVEVAEHVVDRDTWVREQTQPESPADRRTAVVARAPTQAADSEVVLKRKPGLRFEYNYGTGFTPNFGGPDTFVLYQVYAGVSAKVWVRDDTWVQGSLRLRLFDNYDKFKFDGASALPHVRTDLREYLTTSRLNMGNLQATHTGKFNDNNYYSVYGGYLEDMFGGVGGEWLFRPFASRLAYGVDLNWVRQRDFHEDFRFRDYKVKTGHGTVYWDTGWNDILAKFSVGQYLAGDKGATVELQKRWDNGVVLGVFATKTNVSSAEFGEGSFDKGIYLSVPFETMLTRSSRNLLSWTWRPLTRDGGAKLTRAVELYDVTRARSDRTLETAPAPLPTEVRQPADVPLPFPAMQLPTAPPPPATVTKPVASTVVAESPGEFRLIEALYRQGYRNTTAQLDASGRLNISLSHEQILPISRAVGRAARTVLPLAPNNTRELHITFAGRGAPLVKYEFLDVDKLRRFFAGEINAAQLAPSVSVTWLNAGARVANPLAQLDDTETALTPGIFTSLAPEGITLKRVGMDFANAGNAAKDVDWLRAGLIAGGAVFLSSRLDNRVDTFFVNHANSSWIKDGTRIGNALPWIGLAGAGLLALDSSDPTRSRTAFAATEAGVTALALATGMKYAVGRSRPADNLGSGHFNFFGSGNSDSSFPSRHVVTAWAVVTPFALEYDMPWLYGAALMTNFSRTAGRDHWLSDTVASSFIGYGLGRLFWEGTRRKDTPRVLVGSNTIYLSWTN